ncbi:hypothetical protein EYF80_017717 [Liparis tanakae]|uniref:Uncharacterized protein n=1 Tax=Liparis tanakae TaxID=230148 RepID=A0A4Z2I1H6_9TELE|nr:hypothetical protein EYF80_017717 [Liparis tanakae]
MVVVFHANGLEADSVQGEESLRCVQLGAGLARHSFQNISGGVKARPRLVIVNTGDEVGVEPSQGKEDRRGRRGSKRIHVPGKLRTHPERLVEETVSL